MHSNAAGATDASLQHAPGTQVCVPRGARRLNLAGQGVRLRASRFSLVNLVNILLN